MRFNSQQVITIARHITSTAIKNSEIVQPYVKPKHYRRGLAALNALYFALRIADK
ncbi:hypothetical protein ACS8E3_07585 [Psychrobacter sp. 2Y5]|uniref:hypothetical protein n=1 Tax=unclassified Psychrobacter TaxID=196806 RepID=UPI003F4860D0